MFTNADLQAAINEFGDRIIAIGLNNGKNVIVNITKKIGSEFQVKASDIQFKTIGSCDVFGIPRMDLFHKTKYTVWHTTEFIEYIGIADEENYVNNQNDKFVDPYVFN